MRLRRQGQRAPARGAVRGMVRLLVLIPLTGLVTAALLTAGWVVLGSPDLAHGATWFQVVGTGTSSFDAAPDKPFFFLALGNDGRSDADKGLGDAIHVVGVNPVAGKATILNVPRDTTAPAGDKINSYHALSGLPGIIGQLNQMMGIQIRYAITTNFPGFVSMIDEIGGIDVNVPQAMHDVAFSGANFEPGPQHLTGDLSLRFVRDRHSLTRGDIDRTGNQALFILSALSTLRAQNPGDAGAIHLVAVLYRHIRTQNVSLTDLFRLGRFALTLDPANIKSVTIPVGTGAGTNLSVGPDAGGLFQDFADDAVLENH